jgi:hypothetical protein
MHTSSQITVSVHPIAALIYVHTSMEYTRIMAELGVSLYVFDPPVTKLAVQVPVDIAKHEDGHATSWSN